MPPLYRAWPKALRFSKADPRFCYCSHIPEAVTTRSAAPDLLVAVHGSNRSAMAYRDGFAGFAESHACVVLAPLFPVSPLGDGNGDGYKYLAEGELRYDLILLRMIAELEDQLGRPFGRILMFGFSGGGHFVHRFLYLHPQRLSAVSIGAPGGVTLVDDQTDWWVGTRNVEALFGIRIAPEALRGKPIQLVIGENDTETFGYSQSPYFRPEAARLGSNRQERLAALQACLVGLGARVEKAVVPGIAHEGLKIIPTVTAFFARQLAGGA